VAEAGCLLHNKRGDYLNLLGRRADANVHTRAAIALDPARHNAHKNLGLALAGQGRLGEAVRCLLEADPVLVVACHEWRARSGRVGSA